MEQKTMYCANLYAPGDLRYEQKPIPAYGADEVLVQIKNCGVCGSDIGRILVNGTYHFPTVPGHEFSGEVVKDTTGEYLGMRVAVFPLLPCFNCDMCKDERYAQCKNYDYYGSRRDGGFAEYIAVKKWNLIPLPDGVSYEEGAMTEPTAVAYHAVKKLKLKEGDNLLITGAGTIGLIAGMWAKSFGAKQVYYLDLDERKLTFCRKLGFEAYTDDIEADAVLEGTGASSAFAAAIAAVRRFGTIVLMGNPGGAVTLSPKEYQSILRKELHLSGTWNSSYSQKEQDWKDSLAAMAAKKLQLKPLITHRISLQDCLQTMQGMKSGKDFYCKVIITNEK